MRFRLIVAAALIAAVAVPAFAQQTERQKLSEELLVLLDIPKNIQQSFEMVKKMIPGQMEKMGEMTGQKKDPAAMAAAADQQTSMIDMIAKEMSWDNMKDEFVNLYAETFTEEELKGLIEFYQSPAGRKFIEKQPELMRRSMEMNQRVMMKIMPKIQEMQQQQMMKMRAPGAGAPAPTTPMPSAIEATP